MCVHSVREFHLCIENRPNKNWIVLEKKKLETPSTRRTSHFCVRYDYDKLKCFIVWDFLIQRLCAVLSLWRVFAGPASPLARYAIQRTSAWNMKNKTKTKKKQIFHMKSNDDVLWQITWPRCEFGFDKCEARAHTNVLTSVHWCVSACVHRSSSSCAVRKVSLLLMPCQIRVCRIEISPAVSCACGRTQRVENWATQIRMHDCEPICDVIPRSKHRNCCRTTRHFHTRFSMISFLILLPRCIDFFSASQNCIGYSPLSSMAMMCGACASACVLVSVEQ